MTHQEWMEKMRHSTDTAKIQQEAEALYRLRRLVVALVLLLAMVGIALVYRKSTEKIDSLVERNLNVR